MNAMATRIIRGSLVRWSIVIPVYNEADFLPQTLTSMLAQTTAFDLIIVDNGSTDGCIDNARKQLAAHPGKVTFLHEPRPGQVYALQTGIAAVDTEFTAICDADTYYPPHYLAAATSLFYTKGADYVAACAYLRREGLFNGLMSMMHRLLAARILPHQNHTSGAAQTFRTSALRAAGGYDPALWPYVLKDHELMHRVLKQGRQIYHSNFWCTTSDRRADRRNVRWTLAERVIYHLTSRARQHDFFYRFLANRFDARGQRDTVLRDRNWGAA
jgi:glycosyltransferase involved in cell wall biosynthesis